MREKILDLLRRHAPEGTEVTAASRLREDLMLNSLSMMMILWEAEQILGRDLDVTAFSAVKTVGGLLETAGIGEES